MANDHGDEIAAIAEPVERIHVQPKTEADSPSSRSSTGQQSSRDANHHAIKHGIPEVVDSSATGNHSAVTGANRHEDQAHRTFLQRIQAKGFLRFVLTRQFWIILLLGQILALCITSTNTFSSLLATEGTNIPAFQTFFNYVLLNVVYTSFTLYKYGIKGWARLVYKDGWKYFLFAFADVEGNYFTVLAYRYTTILSAQLINFWAIVVVVIVSLIFLKVRYRITQYAGILVCIAGMGLLISSDHITGANTTPGSDPLKGDLFALLGATFYGLANVVEEYLLSKRPLYEVIGQLAFYAMIINGVQAGIFDRSSFRTAVWNSDVGGYLTGFTLILSLFYSIAPLVFRMASAAFFNISLLTANFWGTIIGVKAFGLTIHWLYPIAFVLIIVGLVVYFLTEGIMGEAVKPWLGRDQEAGVKGLGTARRMKEERGKEGMVAETEAPRQGIV
ncbi:MAG: hypothetical protein M1831_007107 [Alyxoria varia]|nr:MAG: hypothetical protein M1831_007107 [Alyxoria varia]